jgi:hypothetical protein
MTRIRSSDLWDTEDVRPRQKTGCLGFSLGIWKFSVVHASKEIKEREQIVCPRVCVGGTNGCVRSQGGHNQYAVRIQV